MTILGTMFRQRGRAVTASLLLASAACFAGSAQAAITVTSDPILYWNNLAIGVPGNVAPSAPAQARVVAMLNIAMHDAVNATAGGPNRSYLSGVTTPGGDSRAAAAQAARDVLVALNPANTAQYDAALASNLALIGNGTAKTNGIATGAAYAAAVLANRTGDGASTANIPYTTTGLPGDYRPTTPGGTPALPGWGNVKTFVLSSVNDVAPAPPPALTSAAYAAAYNEVKDIGALNSATRTVDQTNSALFWDISNGVTWMQVGLLVAEDEGLDTLGFARVFALLSTGLADALIAGFDSKYDNRLWRPVTAIQLGDTDDNAATVGDANWNSLFASPLHPSYVSTHSALSGTASTILQSFFGDDEGFEFYIGSEFRKFTSLSQAEMDAANSRLWGGIHFRFDNEAGLTLGRQIGNRALASGAFAAVPEPSSWVMMIAGFGIMGIGLRARRRNVAVQFT